MAGPKKKSPKAPKGFSRKAAKAVNKKRNSATSKLHGKTVMTEDKRKPGRKMGYASTAKTKLPKYSPKKLTTKQGRKATRKAN